jgi:hypothetical protein
MRADAAEADRRFEVRSAARGWCRASVIDETARLAIDAAYPDDRVRVGRVFRILYFVFTIIALEGAFVLIALSFDIFSHFGPFSLVFGLACLALTEYQIGVLKHAQRGIEAASSLVGLGHVISGIEALNESLKQGDVLFFLLCALISAGASWRWGYWPYAVLSGIFLVGLLSQFAYARLLWIIVASLLLPVLTAGSELPRLAPSHRRSCAALLAFALVVLYVVVNFYSLDEEIIEFISSKPHAIYKSSALRHISLALTGILPVVVFAWGLRSRRRLFLFAGALMAVVSLATLIFYAHLASLWIVFSASGLALIAAAVLIQRWLDSGPGRERRGFAAQVLFESPEKRSALELAGTVVTLTPQAAAPPEKGGFRGGGGEFGGGGASGTF